MRPVFLPSIDLLCANQSKLSISFGASELVTPIGRSAPGEQDPLTARFGTLGETNTLPDALVGEPPYRRAWQHIKNHG